MCLQKKELESQVSEKPATEKPTGEKPRVARSFNQKRPVADDKAGNVATLSHDVLAGVSALLFVHRSNMSVRSIVQHFITNLS